MLSKHYWWRRHLLSYTLLFTAVALCIFLPYVFSDTSLVWQSDGITQHLPALVQWQADLQHLLSTGNWPDQWSWQIGLGADYYQTFSYYTLGDIFSYGVAFISNQHILAYYEWLIIIRLFLAGVAILTAIKYFTSSTNLWVNTLVAIAYVFTGYTAFSAFEHPFFINPLILLPLLFVSFDYLLTTHKLVPFTFMVFWTLWNNYYFAFMLFLALGIYWLIKTTFTHQWLNWRLHIRVLISGIIGTLMAFILFLPNVLGVLSSSRSGAPLANGLIVYPEYYYLALPGTFLGNTATPYFWFTGGFAAILILGLIYSIRHWQEYRILATVWLIAGIGLLMPAFAAIFNGGSSPSNRWTFILALPLAISAVYFLNNLPTLTKRDWTWFYITGAFMGISLFVTSAFSWQTPFGLLIGIYVVTLLVIKQGHFPLLTVVTAFNVIVLMGHTHMDDFDPNKTTMLSRPAVQALISQQKHYPTESVPAKATLQRSLVSDPLQNAKGIAPGNNLPMLSDAHAAESYWSYQNGATNNVMNDLGILTSTNNDVLNDLNSRSVITHLLGINQVFQNPDGPDIANFEYGPKINHQTLGTTKYAYPLAYVAPNVISKERYAAATPTEREALLSNSVITDETSEKVTTKLLSDELVRGKLSDTKSGTPNNTLHYTYQMSSKDDKPGLYLPANPALKNTELHLELTNIRFTPYTFQETFAHDLATYNESHKTLEKEAPGTDMKYNPTAFKWQWYKDNLGQYGSSIGGYSITTTYTDQKQKFVQTSQKNLSFFNPRSSATINLGPAIDTSTEQFIPLKFSQPGTYSFDVQLVGIPTDKRFTDIATDIQQRAVPINLSNNRMHATYTARSDEIITTSIPYSTGWTSESHELLEVNNGFLGIQVKSGENNIRITYATPGLKLGSWLSLVGLIGFFILILIESSLPVKIKKRVLKNKV